LRAMVPIAAIRSLEARNDAEESGTATPGSAARSCTYDDIKRQIELFEKIRHDQEAVMLGAKASLEIERFPSQ
jgi:hypothetical protein